MAQAPLTRGLVFVSFVTLGVAKQAPPLMVNETVPVCTERKLMSGDGHCHGLQSKGRKLKDKAVGKS